VNKSSLLWKVPTGVAMKSEEYAAAARALQPIQLGLGAKFVNRLAHTAQDYYSQGFSLGETDAENAFNSASRQKMLEAVVRNCPSWTRLFWMGYCSHRPLVLLRRGSDFEVLRSSEGSRQGCKFGSFVFCLTVQPAYSEVDAAFPGVIFRAATDDLKSFARDPADIIATFPAIASALHRHAGITLNVSKSKVLLPPGVPDIDRIPDGVQVLREGTIVVGAAIGSDEFIRSHVTNIVKAKTQNLQALSLLDPQSALLLLSSCLVPALGYLLQVTPPRIMLEAARMWDVAIDAARHRCMCDPSIGRDPVVGPGLQLLADKKARLPLKLRGLGHYSAALLSPISFYSSYAHHASLDRGTRRRLLLTELRFTIECLRTSLSDCDFQDKIVPAEDIGLKRPGRKLQRELTCDAHSLARTQLIDSIPDSTAGKFDRRAFAITDKPDSWLPFFVAPTSSDLVVDPQYFIAGLRFYLLLPQLLRLSDVPALVDVPAQDQPNFSYEADPCLATVLLTPATAILLTLTPVTLLLNQKFVIGTSWSSMCVLLQYEKLATPRSKLSPEPMLRETSAEQTFSSSTALHTSTSTITRMTVSAIRSARLTSKASLVAPLEFLTSWRLPRLITMLINSLLPERTPPFWLACASSTSNPVLSPLWESMAQALSSSSTLPLATSRNVP
jgi:hypothetical protein